MITWDELETIAYGRLKLSKREFLKSTMREFNNRLRGHFKSIEEQDQKDWERTRWQTHYLALVSGNFKKGQAPKTPQDIILFPWEKAVVKKAYTKEEIQKQREDILKAFGGR